MQDSLYFDMNITTKIIYSRASENNFTVNMIVFNKGVNRSLKEDFDVMKSVIGQYVSAKERRRRPSLSLGLIGGRSSGRHALTVMKRSTRC